MILAVAVAFVRLFVAESFLISTGSMAPRIRGYHYQVACPDCQYVFAFTATEKADASLRKGSSDGLVLECPNCHYDHIRLQDVPRVEGDQILVNKNAFQWHEPQRFESVVFRNPQHPTEVYLKRLIGLPGETISFKEGDIYVNGQIQRKGLACQQQMRIPVHDSRFHPQFQDDNYRTPWQSETSASNEGWQQVESGFRCENPTGQTIHWLNFQPWVRKGGAARSEVTLENWPTDLPLPTEETILRYDTLKKVMSCRGALPAEVVNRLSELTIDSKFRVALETLFENSHHQTLLDQTAYNVPTIELPHPVRDLMVQLEVESTASGMMLQLEMNDGWFPFVCELDFENQISTLRLADASKPLREGKLPPLGFEVPIRIEMSVMDR
ncbi:MAG: signal peptidase I, partial [Planctomycetaceae bacterium]|nr:signal peptidase I [Planctomycetaceae bacterium]